MKSRVLERSARPAVESSGLTRDQLLGVVSLHAPVAPAGRQGNPAQEPEPDLLPDQRRRPRGGAGRGRHCAASRATTGSTRTIATARCAWRSASRRSRCCSPRSAPSDDPSVGGRQMPSHWGHTAAQHRVGLEPHRHAGAAGGRRRRSRRHLQPRRADSRPRRALPRRRNRLRVARRGRDQRRRVLGGAQRRLHQAAARALPGRGQRLRHLGAGRSADRRRRHLALVRGFPGLHVDSIDGTDFFASLRAMRDAAAYVRARKGPGARPRPRASAPTRTRCPTTRSCTSRRPSARPKRGAIRSPGSPSSCTTHEPRHRRGAGGNGR